MPQRIPQHRPVRVRAKPPYVPSLSEKARPNAAARGYCSPGWFATRKRILIRDEYQCRSCKKLCHAKCDAHIDHIIPKSKGGSDDESNLQLLCRSCHARKTLEENKPVH